MNCFVSARILRGKRIFKYWFIRNFFNFFAFKYNQFKYGGILILVTKHKLLIRFFFVSVRTFLCSSVRQFDRFWNLIDDEQIFPSGCFDATAGRWCMHDGGGLVLIYGKVFNRAMFWMFVFHYTKFEVYFANIIIFLYI